MQKSHPLSNCGSHTESACPNKKCFIPNISTRFRDRCFYPFASSDHISKHFLTQVASLSAARGRCWISGGGVWFAAFSSASMRFLKLTFSSFTAVTLSSASFWTDSAFFRCTSIAACSSAILRSLCSRASLAFEPSPLEATEKRRLSWVSRASAVAERKARAVSHEERTRKMYCTPCTRVPSLCFCSSTLRLSSAMIRRFKTSTST